MFLRRRLTPARPSFTCLQRSRPHSTRSFLARNARASTVQVSLCQKKIRILTDISSMRGGTGFWSVPCYSAKQIELSFDGNRFAIHPDDFYLGRVSAGSTACVAGVLSIGNGLPPNLAIIGDVFLKSCERMRMSDLLFFVVVEGFLDQGIPHTITATAGG